MATTTPINGFSIPQLSDAPNIETAVNTFANAVDSRVIPRFATVAARGTAIPSPITGQLAHCADTTELYIYNGTLWVSARPRVKFKTADEGVSNSASPQDDDHLVFSVEINSEYVLAGELFISATNTGRDFLANWTVPASTVGWWALGGLDPAANNILGEAHFGGTTTITANRAIEANVNLDPVAGMVRAYFDTAGTAGNVQFRWSQNVAQTSTSTTVYKGSWMEIWKVG